jgi:Arc/MetJ-type ribon-helix-helix transcriptional regulator
MPRNPQTTAVVTVSLPVPMARQVDRRCKADHRTRSELVRDALRFYLHAQPDIDEAGRQAYFDAKAGKGLSPIFDTADEGIAHLHAAAKRHAVAKRRKKR